MESCCQRFLLSMGLRDQQRILFTTSEFPGLNPYIFSVYRFVVTIYFIAVTCWYVAASSDEYGWIFLIFLTNWTFILVTVYLIVASLSSVMFLIRRSRHAKDDTISSDSSANNNVLPLYYKLHWALFNMAAAGSLLVTLIYWGALYSPDTSVTIFTDVNTHALTTLVMFIETFLSAIPVHLSHFIYTVAYGICFTLFSVIYWAAGGKDNNGNPYIYSIIDYESETGYAVLTIIGALIGATICHVIIWLIFKLRMKIVSKWFSSANMESEIEPVGTTGV